MRHRSQNHPPLRRGRSFRAARPNLALVNERRKNHMRKVYIYVTVAMTLSAAILLWNSLFRAVTAAHDEEEHLFVWAGDQARANADFLAVINLDRHSNNNGE